jgi:hypothetical protein
VAVAESDVMIFDPNNNAKIVLGNKSVFLWNSFFSYVYELNNKNMLNIKT